MTMASLGILQAARKIMLSKFFLVAVLLWLLAAFLISVAGVGFSSSPDGNPVGVQDSQTSSIFVLLGNDLVFYSQNFNAYGAGIPGTYVYYNLSGLQANSGSVASHITGGFAGKTNSTGFIGLNIPGAYANYQYYLDVHYYNPENGFNQSATEFLSTSLIPQSVPQSTVAITPVKSSTDSGTYALHMWSMPGTHIENATLFYVKGSSFNGFISQNGTVRYQGSVPLGKMNLDGPVNIQTGIPAVGTPYYYLVGLNYSNGDNAGQTFLQTAASPIVKAQQNSGFIFGTSLLFVFFGTASLIPVFSTTIERRPGRFDKFIPEVFPDNKDMKGESLFLKRICSTLIVSIPFLFITAFFAYLSSTTGVGSSPGYGVLLFYSLSLLMIVMMAAAYVSILIGLGVIVPQTKDSAEYRKFNRRLMISLIPLYFPFLFGFQLNLYTLGTVFPIPSIVVLNNFIDPFMYPFLIFQRISGSLLIGRPYPFSPSVYGITTASILIMGAVWIAVWILLPFLVLRRQTVRKPLN